MTATPLNNADFIKPASGFSDLAALRIDDIHALAISGNVVSLQLSFQPSAILQVAELNEQAALPQ